LARLPERAPSILALDVLEQSLEVGAFELRDGAVVSGGTTTST